MPNFIVRLLTIIFGIFCFVPGDPRGQIWFPDYYRPYVCRGGLHSDASVQPLRGWMWRGGRPVHGWRAPAVVKMAARPGRIGFAVKPSGTGFL